MYTLPELNYSYDALEPHISSAIMELHHNKHHATYVEKLNAALELYSEWQSLPIEKLLPRIKELPQDVQRVVRNNGGGHYNHSLFWNVLSPNGGGEPDGELGKAIAAKFGSFDKFVQAFDAAAIGLFGSGWVWLTPELDIVTSPNQDSPLIDGETEPLMGLDVWEHAYYLDYKNHRDEYVNAWWNVVDWEFVARRYAMIDA